MIYTSEYQDNWNEDEGDYGHWTNTKEYHAKVDNNSLFSFSGTATANGDLSPSLNEWWWEITYNWSDADPGGTATETVDEEGSIETVTGPGWNPMHGIWYLDYGNFVPSVSWPGIVHYYANISYDWGYCTYTRNSKTYMKIRTGGKAGKNRQNLFGINASAAEYGRPQSIEWVNGPDNWENTPGNGIAPDRIRVLGKNLGDDGNLFIMLPDNATLDLGAVAPGRHYSLGVGAGKYKMFIQANGSILRPDRVVPTAKFCVGQRIGFAPVWNPSAPPNVASASYLWDLSGKFVNHSTHPCSSCSVNYDVDLNLLDVETPSVWYVSGGDKNVYAHVSIRFSNGQSVTVNRSGQFSMFRPSILGHGQVSQGAVELNTNGLPTVKLGMLAAGADFIHWSTDVGLDTSFSANLFHVQLVDWESMYDIGLYCISKYTGTSGLYWLDNSDPYSDGLWPVNPDGGKNYVTVKGISFGDGPDISGNFCSFAQLTPSFKSYLCFQPTSAGSIPITLERVEWGEHGRTDLTSGIWIMTTSNITGPSFSDDDSFPFWEQVFSNTSGN